MQRKDIEEQLDLLKTAINEKQPADNVINILTKLKAEVVPTEDILRVRSPTPRMTALQGHPDTLAPATGLILSHIRADTIIEHQSWYDRGQATRESGQSCRTPRLRNRLEMEDHSRSRKEEEGGRSKAWDCLTK
jgi:hypothetical protein